MDKLTAVKKSADLKKLGHTSGNQYGQNPHARNTVRQAPQEKSAK